MAKHQVNIKGVKKSRNKNEPFRICQVKAK